MNKPQIQNQLHNPPKKKSGEGPRLNVLKKMYYKEGTSSMLFCKDITIPASKVLIESIKDTMGKLGVELNGHFIVTS